ncbi:MULTISPECIES: hypothetical protein [Amylolactobacillus]|uniref:Uncharacterized protein n=1 Tax=Amylolactobacillus amylophilus DSM 20533 = JCM 1125 TaxID=1423721 RepID=A0A1L6XDX0_9LACO|nr:MULTISPECIES: hypothetical protein [Amylolactobacillus]APT19140.1 hypothetical protein LA20533_07720 [Amylolactobacillus amylophilus DSM 20533 = JCM 1125]GED79628.1 hypothetical protein LAM01_01010 [Amylolactobacillus amylophilus]
MTLSKTQVEFMRLAADAVVTQNFDVARDYLVEANKISVEPQISRQLVEIELELQEKDQAYLTIKEMPDLFSDINVFELYQKVLAINHLHIEQQQIVAQVSRIYDANEFALYQDKVDANLAEPVTGEKRGEIFEASLALFSTGRLFTQTAIRQLHQLSQTDYLQLARLYLTLPNMNVQNKTFLVEDLIRLRLEETVKVTVLDQPFDFVPATTDFFFKTNLYVTGQRWLEQKLEKDPILLEQILGEFSYCLGALYPVEERFIPDVAEFCATLVEFVARGQFLATDDPAGQTNVTELLNQIYHAR